MEMRMVRIMLTHNPSRRQTTPSAVSGVPVWPYCDLTLSDQPLREVFRRSSILPCTGRQLSGWIVVAYFIPSMRFLWNYPYPNKFPGVCQGKSCIQKSLRNFHKSFTFAGADRGCRVGHDWMTELNWIFLFCVFRESKNSNQSSSLLDISSDSCL